MTPDETRDGVPDHVPDEIAAELADTAIIPSHPNPDKDREAASAKLPVTTQDFPARCPECDSIHLDIHSPGFRSVTVADCQECSWEDTKPWGDAS
jgi:hypothetical protein